MFITLLRLFQELRYLGTNYKMYLLMHKITDAVSKMSFHSIVMKTKFVGLSKERSMPNFTSLS